MGININGRAYEILDVPFEPASDVAAFVIENQSSIQGGKLGFVGTNEFKERIKPIMLKYATYDGFKLESTPSHFEVHKADYFPFVMQALSEVAAPFFTESPTNSAQEEESTPTEIHSLPSQKPTW